MLLRYRTVKPRLVGEYRALIENDLLPATEEGAFKGFVYNRMQMGSNPNT